MTVGEVEALSTPLLVARAAFLAVRLLWSETRLRVMLFVLRQERRTCDIEIFYLKRRMEQARSRSLAPKTAVVTESLTEGR